MILGATIEAAIYIVVVFLCLFDCFRTVVEETQIDSILNGWSMGATRSMRLVLTRRLSVCVYVKNSIVQDVICYFGITIDQGPFVVRTLPYW